jgi:hypothetical protein
MSRLHKSAIALVLGFLLPAPAAGQAARDSRVQVTIVDPSGAVVPDTTVTLTGLEPATQRAPVPAVKSNDKGIAIVERVPPGRYSISAEFPGFGLGLLRDIRARAGDSRHVVVLPLQSFEDKVVVARDTQEAAADRRTSEFGLKLSEEQISALSDDPAELQRQLAELAGLDATFRVDSFEGQQLPPKAQIKSIHVTRDQFAAEAANPGSTFVDIVTQPGVGPVRGGMNLSFRDGSMSGKSQFTDVRGPEQTRNFGGNVGGTLVNGRTSFNASINGQNDYTTPILNAVLPTGTRAETLNVRAPNSFFSGNAVVDHALTRDQTLRIGVQVNRQKRENIGIGSYSLPERGFSQEQRMVSIRVQEAGPIGRRSFINTRLSLQKGKIDMHPATQAPAIVVLDAFTAGGSQREQFADIVQSTLASDIDYVRGRHSFRGGVQIDGNWFSARSRFNYLGTYTFANLADYNAGRPMLYTQSLGFPVNKYHNLQGAVYFQDDIRVRRGLTFSPGLRYTMQTQVDDRSGFAPRFGFTWAPSTNGRTTLRGSAGLFHGFMNLEMIEQSLRLNGDRQREIYLTNPSYPDPGPVTELLIPSNKYLIGDFNLQRNLRYSAGIDQVLSPRVRVNVLYNYIHLQQQPRGRNVNPLIDGVRPDPRYANVIEAVTDTEVRRHELSINSIINLAAPSPALNSARVNWRRLNLNAGYSVIRARSNSDGTWAVSPSGNPEDDWGRQGADSPYRVQLLLTSNQIRNVTANVTYLANAGQPYNLTTGRDDNGDGFVNDRPAGVGLRTLRAAGQQTLNARVQYAFQMGAPAGATGAAGPQGRYRLNVFVNVQNLTNHLNLGGYSGVMTSPFFLRPTLAANPRRIDMGMGVNF